MIQSSTIWDQSLSNTFERTDSSIINTNDSTSEEFASVSEEDFRQTFFEQDFDAMAKDFVGRYCSVDGERILYHLEGHFLLYNGTYYERLIETKKLTDKLATYIRTLNLHDKKRNLYRRRRHPLFTKISKTPFNVYALSMKMGQSRFQITIPISSLAKRKYTEYPPTRSNCITIKSATLIRLLTM